MVRISNHCAGGSRSCCRAAPRWSLPVLLALWAPVTGCSDYAVKALVDPSAGASDTAVGALDADDLGQPEVEECPEYDGLPEVVAYDESCASTPDTGSIAAVVEWKLDGFREYWEYDQVLMAPVVGQLTDDNGDGSIDAGDTPDIVVVTDDGGQQGGTHGILRRISGNGDEGVRSLQRVMYLDDIQIHPYRYTNVALGDIDHDGSPEMVLMSSVIRGALGEPSEPVEDTDSPVGPPPPSTGDSHGPPMSAGDICVLTAFTAGLELLWVAEDVQVPCGGHAPALVDLEGDGAVDVLLGPYVVRGADGVLLAKNRDAQARYEAYEEIGMHVTAADLNMDGVQEIILGHTLVDPSGATMCQAVGLEDGYAAPADFDGDGDGEVVVVGNGTAGVYDDTCQVSVSWSLAGGGTGGPPTVSDFDADGEVEVGIADADTYTVYERDGQILWSHPVSDASSHATGSVVFDFEADGRPEVVYADESRLWILSGEDGSVRLEDDLHASRTLHEYPTVADVDGDGSTELIVPNGGGHRGEDRAGLYVLGAAEGTWLMSRQVWNQHAYSIVNVNDDLTIPSPARSNWPVHNNFRSGDPQPLASWRRADPVPVADICLSECREGRILVVVRAGNSGAERFDPGVPVSLYTQPSAPIHLGTNWTTEPVEPGATSEALRFEVAPEDIREDTLWLVVDDDAGREAVVDECNEDNNVLVFEAVHCP
ncbi:MAG: VCBS repeat-containing protein [Myxococcota bacterium]|nr:VCBS repeat-containing protein [Myxococcota bacterium]